MLFARIACAAVLALLALPTWGEQHFVELSGGAYNISVDEAGGTSARFTGRGLQARSRIYVEGNWFVFGDVRIATTDGDPGGVKTDLDLRFYRTGIGKSGGVGRGGAQASIWAEFARLRTKTKPDGGERSRANEQGGGIQLRFDRFAPNGRFLPYAQAGYLFFDNFDGPEAKVGVAVQFEQFRPFLQYQYLRLSDDGNRFIPRTISLGVRFLF